MCIRDSITTIWYILRTRCAIAITLLVRYLPVLLRNQTKNVVIADHILAPIIIPSAISKVIIPLLSAAKVMTLVPVLVCKTTVITIHNSILLNNHILASSNAKRVDKVSTDSFIYDRPRKSSPNQNKNLATVINLG